MIRLKLFALCAALLVVGAAQATHIVEFAGSADCDGWQFDGAIWFGSATTEVTIDYAVDLLQSGAVVLSATGAFPVTSTGPYQRILFGSAGAWGEDLCGGYTVAGTITMSFPGFTETQTFAAVLDCDCPPEGGCFRTPGYWKNHDWPVDSLEVAGAETSRDDLMAILWTPVGGDATVILAKHLIAAKLNVISGSDSSIQETIDDADAYLVEHPVFSSPRGAAKAAGLALKDDLADYNEQGCDGHDDTLDKSMTVEESTWSTVRDMFR